MGHLGGGGGGGGGVGGQYQDWQYHNNDKLIKIFLQYNMCPLKTSINL